MSLAVLIAVLAVGLGAALTLLSASSPRVLGPLRTFATVAALAVVVAHLLPESLHELQGRAAIAFALAWLLPSLLHWVGDRHAQSDHDHAGSGERLRLEVGYAGLLLHHVGDGLGIGAYSTLPGGVQGNLDVIVALVAHTMPLVAVIALAYMSVLGRRAALVRVAGLAAASVAGVLLTSIVPLDRVESATAWVAAIASGLLLHVVTHDLESDPPKAVGARVFDLVAAGAGIAVALLGAHDHAEAALPGFKVFERAYALALKAALPFALGLAAAAALELASRRVRQRGGAAQGSLAALVHGLVGALLRPFSARGERSSLNVATLLGAPALGLPILALSIGFFGIEFSALRFAAALVLPIVVTLVLHAFSNRPEGSGSEEPAHAEAPRDTSFHDWLDHLSASLALGLLSAALLDTYLKPGALLAWSGSPLEFTVVSGIALAGYLPAPAAIPLCWVLVQKGLSPGGALIALLLGPALGFRPLRALFRSFGAFKTALAAIWMVSLAWALAFLQNRLGSLGPLFESGARLHPAAEVVLQVGAALVAFLVLRRVFALGARMWLAAVGSFGLEPKRVTIRS